MYVANNAHLPDRSLGDTGSGQAMIRTRKGLGYVFVAPVELVAELPHSAIGKVRKGALR